jgi:transcriptional regulator with XRE-family HTH domain
MKARRLATNGSPNALAVFLRARRGKLGLTPSRAALRTDGKVSRIEVATIERGHWPNPPIELLRGFALAYRVPFVELLLQAGHLTAEDIIEWGGSSESRRLIARYFERYVLAERHE